MLLIAAAVVLVWLILWCACHLLPTSHQFVAIRGVETLWPLAILTSRVPVPGWGSQYLHDQTTRRALCSEGKNFLVILGQREVQLSSTKDRAFSLPDNIHALQELLSFCRACNAKMFCKAFCWGQQKWHSLLSISIAPSPSLYFMDLLPSLLHYFKFLMF